MMIILSWWSIKITNLKNFENIVVYINRHEKKKKKLVELTSNELMRTCVSLSQNNFYCLKDLFFVKPKQKKSWN